MKRTAISGLIITAVFLAAPAFAADEDLCTSNLQRIDDVMSTNAATMSEGLKTQLMELVSNAKAAQSAGNAKDCIKNTDMANQLLLNLGKGGNG
ncbi:hypothetical protein D3C76_751830 [compost metagenome]